MPTTLKLCTNNYIHIISYRYHCQLLLQQVIKLFVAIRKSFGNVKNAAANKMAMIGGHNVAVCQNVLLYGVRKATRGKENSATNDTNKKMNFGFLNNTDGTLLVIGKPASSIVSILLVFCDTVEFVSELFTFFVVKLPLDFSLALSRFVNL